MNKLPLTSFQSFASDDKNIIWEEDEREFSVDGKMYDVATTKIINGKKTYFCLSDEKETDLVKNYYNKLLADNESSKQKKNKLNFQFQIVFFKETNVAIPTTFIYSQKHFLVFDQNAVSVSLSVCSPPPKFS